MVSDYRVCIGRPVRVGRPDEGLQITEISPEIDDEDTAKSWAISARPITPVGHKIVVCARDGTDYPEIARYDGEKVVE